MAILLNLAKQFVSLTANLHYVFGSTVLALHGMWQEGSNENDGPDAQNGDLIDLDLWLRT